MIDIRLALMCGTDIPVPELQTVLHQPTIKEISLIGETDYFIGAQCLCLNKSMFSQDNSVLDSTTNFQIFMTIMAEQETKEKKQSVIQTLQLLFPGYQVIFTPRSILFNQGEKQFMVDDTTFEVFQEYLKEIFCFKSGKMDQQNFNPGDKKAKEIADKLMRGRQRIAAEKGGKNNSVLSQYLSIITVGIHSMTLKDAMGLTMYQMYDLIERYSLYMNWDIDIRSRLAGAKPDGQPDDWMKNIH